MIKQGVYMFTLSGDLFLVESVGKGFCDIKCGEDLSRFVYFYFEFLMEYSEWMGDL